MRNNVAEIHFKELNDQTSECPVNKSQLMAQLLAAMLASFPV
jgi:hypothetical protein